MPTIIVTTCSPIEASPFYPLEKERFKRCSVTSSLYSAEESEEESVATEDSHDSSYSTPSEEFTTRIKIYEPQLNPNIYNPSIPQIETTKKRTDSRLLSAFQKIYHKPAILETIKPTASKSASFREKIKNKFQPKKQLTMTRSGSLSSMAKRWSLNRKRDTFELKWSMSSHLLHKTTTETCTAKKVKFAKSVNTRDTFSKADYDRRSDPEAVCVGLTPLTAQMIKEELNAYKLHEMQVHEQSKVHTQFFI